MLEIAVVLGVFVAMAGGVASTALAVETVFAAGLWLIVGGLAFGVPTGVLYHLVLRRSLLRLGPLPVRWWLRPIQLNPSVPTADRRLVLGFCYAGAAGFLVTLLGCVVVSIAAWRTL
ncbi:MAG TPA: hypothetical protein VEG67_05345 [Myxococcota bacterium]|nr:hypothetical protein [Myxococcota bacterium]